MTTAHGRHSSCQREPPRQPPGGFLRQSDWRFAHLRVLPTSQPPQDLPEVCFAWGLSVAAGTRPAALRCRLPRRTQAGLCQPRVPRPDAGDLANEISEDGAFRRGNKIDSAGRQARPFLERRRLPGHPDSSVHRLPPRDSRAGLGCRGIGRGSCSTVSEAQAVKRK